MGFNMLDKSASNLIRHRGFTLAEVLITLAIIGIVAALTIPGLIASVQDLQHKTAWKKAFSRISEVTLTVKEDNGGTLVGFANNLGNPTADPEINFITVYKSHLSAVKTCTWSTNRDMCWHPSSAWFDLAGAPQSSNSFMNIGLILTDGSFLRFYMNNTTCAFDGCGEMMVDVNGFKGPNTIGKDIYGIHIRTAGAKPWGEPGDEYAQDSNCSTGPNNWGPKGWTCGYQFLLN